MNRPVHYQKILKLAKADKNVLGLILSGSRGKRFENVNSDYDLRMIVKEGHVRKYEKIVEGMDLVEIDLSIMSLSEFKDYAAWGGPDAWDKYDFSHVRVLVDKTKKLKKMCDQKGKIPKNQQHGFVARSLDGYINAVFRSVKCARNKNVIGLRLEASSSIPYLLDVVFGINGRIKPFLGYLQKELKKYPLKKFPWKNADFLKAILNILEGNITTQQKLLKDVETFARKEGYSKTFDDWEGKDKWAMNINLKK